MKKPKQYDLKSDTPELFYSILSRGYELQYSIKEFCDVKRVKSIKRACEQLSATHEIKHSSKGASYLVKLGARVVE